MSESCDFLIVGAGIVGLTVAWELRKRDPLVKITILEKEPIVCSPDDAIKAFLQSQLDYLAIGSFLVEGDLNN